MLNRAGFECLSSSAVPVYTSLVYNYRSALMLKIWQRRQTSVGSMELSYPGRETAPGGVRGRAPAKVLRPPPSMTLVPAKMDFILICPGSVQKQMQIFPEATAPHELSRFPSRKIIKFELTTKDRICKEKMCLMKRIGIKCLKE